MSQLISHSIDVFMKDVLQRFDSELIDLVFCYIESNRDLLNRYLDILSEQDGRMLRVSNSQIAKSVCQHYNLVTGEEVDNPNSKLIQSYSSLHKQQ